ncbi:hypothetical protein P3T42_005924 [Paraburkholderia sp. GAS38]|uniref:DUF4403 family protein n=1 Tax=Paraburkholderia sp. GAS38 TaxID=3035133 RepID=UPI003D1CBDDB
MEADEDNVLRIWFTKLGKLAIRYWYRVVVAGTAFSFLSNRGDQAIEPNGQGEIIMKLMRVLFLCLPVTLLTACPVTIPSYSVDLPPIKPPANNFQGQFIVTAQHVNLSGLNKKLAAIIPPRTEDDGQSMLKFGFYPDPGTALYVDSNGYVLAYVPFHGSVGIKYFCNLNPVHMDLLASAKPQLVKSSAPTDTWSITLDDAYSEGILAPNSDTHCGGVNGAGWLKVGSLLQSAFSVAAYLFVTPKIRDFEIDVPVQGLAQRLSGPFRIKIKDTLFACIYPNLNEVSLGNISGGDQVKPPWPTSDKQTVAAVDDLNVALLLGGTPAIEITTDQCPASEPQTLVQGRPPTADEKFQMIAVAGIDYSTISKIVGQQIVGLGTRLGPLGRLLSVDHVVARDASGQFLLDVRVSGGLNGDIYFWGTPVLIRDQSGNVTAVTVAGIELAEESRILLDKIRVGLAADMMGLLGDRIRKSIVQPIGPILAPVQTAVANPITSNGVTLSITDLVLEPLSAYSSPAGIQIEAKATGLAVATISGLSGF